MTLAIIDASPASGLWDREFPAGTVRALQLTDTHLYADTAGTLLGINTLASFADVLERFRDIDWPIDLALATGDLVHDASPSGYRQLGAALAGFGVPVFCLPGNHDKPEVMHRELPTSTVSTASVHDIGDWRIVMLDSVIPGEEGGHLDERQLSILADALSGSRRHVLVCMHHQPVEVGSAWIDTMRIDNPADLFDIVDRHAHVRGMLWGHVHQGYDAVRNGVRLMASPSTCVQFAPRSENFKVDAATPGFRLLALLPDGTITSEVVRTVGLPQGIELASAGY